MLMLAMLQKTNVSTTFAHMQNKHTGRKAHAQ